MKKHTPIALMVLAAVIVLAALQKDTKDIELQAFGISLKTKEASSLEHIK